MNKGSKMKNGFTLIEMSIVIVIIGLLVIGVLQGKELIAAAARTAQMTQLDKFQTAITTFRTKYQSLPGDLQGSKASQFGFKSRSGGSGQGDGNGLIQGYYAGIGGYSTIQMVGETALFWSDLATEKLIDGSYNLANDSTLPASDLQGTDIEGYFPKAKLGNSTYINVWSGGKGPGNTIGVNGINYMSVSTIVNILTAHYGFINTANKTPVIDVWTIDQKLDDGLPMSGKVIAMRIGYSLAPMWTNISRDFDEMSISMPLASNTCIDNGGVAGATYKYSLSNDNNANCSFSVEFR